MRRELTAVAMFLWFLSRSVAAVPVVNGQFDLGPLDTFGTVTGWTVPTGAGLNGQASNVANAGFLGGASPASVLPPVTPFIPRPNTITRISQTFNLAAGDFRVQFDLLNNLAGFSGSPSPAFFATMQLASLATFTLTDQIDDSLTGFAFRTVSFTGSTATATTGTLSLSFFNTQTDPNLTQFALVDNVTVTDGIVPEIDTNSARLPMALCFSGFLLLGRRRSRVAVC